MTTSTLEMSVFAEHLHRLLDGHHQGRLLEPLVSAQRADHPVFTELTGLVEGMVMPGDVYARQFDAPAGDACAVISAAVPFAEGTIEANAREHQYPAREWLSDRALCDAIFGTVGRRMAEWLSERGIRGVQVGISNAYRGTSDADGPRASNWSERHVGYACGLGTFGIHGALITQRGASHRLMSFVIDTPCDWYGTPDDDPFGNCLLRTRGTCGACITRCPAGALSRDGRSNPSCRDHAYHTCGERSVSVAGKVVRGCGLCMTGVPCAKRNPMDSGASSR